MAAIQIKEPLDSNEEISSDDDAMLEVKHLESVQSALPSPDPSRFNPEAIILSIAHYNTIVHDSKQRAVFDPHELPRLLAAIHSTDRRLQLAAMCYFRMLLSIQENPPISEVIRCGVIPLFISFLRLKEDPALQFEACWALTNVVYGTSEQTKVVVRAGALPLLVKLLSCDNLDVREQAVWALRNIAADSIAHRDAVLDANALDPLVRCISTTHRLSMMCTGSMVLRNLCRGKPPPPLSQTQPALRLLSQLIYSTSEEAITNACWAISFLSEGSPERIQAVIDEGIIGRLGELLCHPNKNVILPALRTIGNVVTGDSRQTQAVIDRFVVPALVELLRSPSKRIRREACWTLSNITAGSCSQLQSVIDADAVEPLTDLICADIDPDVRSEALWVLTNACSHGHRSQIQQIVSHNCIAPMVGMLSPEDQRMARVLLDALDRILFAGGSLRENDMNTYAIQVARAGGFDKLEELTRCENKMIHQKASYLINVYFDETLLSIVK